MPASYPSSAKTFTSKSDGAGNTIQAAHVNDLQLEVTAIEQDLIAGLPVARGGTGTTSSAWSANSLTFPAVQVPSAGANTLDDYEEGTYTPTWTASSGAAPAISDGTITGRYVKVGIVVHVWITLVAGASTTFGDGGSLIFLLPFTAGSAGVNYIGACLYTNQGVASYPGQISASSGGSTASLTVSASPVTAVTFNNPFAFGTTDSIVVSLTYDAAA